MGVCGLAMETLHVQSHRWALYLASVTLRSLRKTVFDIKAVIYLKVFLLAIFLYQISNLLI